MHKHQQSKCLHAYSFSHLSAKQLLPPFPLSPAQAQGEKLGHYVMLFAFITGPTNIPIPGNI